VRNQLLLQSLVRERSERRFHVPGQFGKSSMLPGSTEPIGGISVIRFPAVHDAVDEGAVGVIDSLGNRVSRVEVVVPQEDKSPGKLLLVAGKCCTRRKALDLRAQRSFGFHVRARSGPQVSQLRGSKQSHEPGLVGHGRKIAQNETLCHRTKWPVNCQYIVRACVAAGALPGGSTFVFRRNRNLRRDGRQAKMMRFMFDFGKRLTNERQDSRPRGARGPAMSTFFALVLVWSLHATTTLAATFTASLDRDTITLGETVTLSLAFVGGQPQNPPSPAQIANVQIAYIGPSSQFSVINGQVSSSVTYNFTVVPHQPGDYTIPALSADVGGEKLSSQALSLKVLKPSAPPPDAVNSGSQLAFLKLMVPKKEMYVGEILAAQFQIYVLNRVQGLSGLQITSFPAEGFNVGKMVEGQRRSAQIGNSVYTVIPVGFTLKAIKGGTLTLGPITASATLELPSASGRRDIFDAFGMLGRGEQRQVVLATDPETVQSLPLPRDNVPAGFAGAVGTYTLALTAGPTNVAAGDPITVKIQIAGRGSLDSLTLPEQPAWHDFKAYPPTTKVDLADSLGLQGTKTFEQIITPQNPDIKELPAVSFSFFDPEQKSYRTLRQPAVPLVVRPGGSAPVPTVLSASRGTQDNAPTAQDIVPLKQRPGSLAQINAPLIQQPWFLALQGVPVLAFLSVVTWRRRTEHLANNPRLRRQRQVSQIVRDGLQQLERLARENNSDEFFATLFRLLQEQLGERLDLPASAITEAVIDERLRPRGVPDTVLAPLQELFQVCNVARYAPVKSSQELAALIAKLKGVLDQLRGLKV